MNNTSCTLLLTVLIGALAVRCSNPTPPVDVSTGGVMYGDVRIVDKYYNPATDVSGVTILVSSSSWSDSTETDLIQSQYHPLLCVNPSEVTSYQMHQSMSGTFTNVTQKILPTYGILHKLQLSQSLLRT